MPTKPVTSEVMEDGGKHWTKAQKEARKLAEELLTNPEKTKNPDKAKKTKLTPPETLSKAGCVVWAKIMKDAEGIELYKNMDTELLEMYCETVVMMREMKKKPMSLDEMKAYQSFGRMLKSYADSLGISPSARARLVKRKADEIEDSFGKEFD